MTPVETKAYWYKQTSGKPLFPELLWSKPENRQHAGKLLIVGGNQYGFAAPAEAFAEAQKAGAGVTKVLLPDALHKTVGRAFGAGEFAPSTPSGSFSKMALAEFLDYASRADATLFAGDLGRNSEVAILLENFLTKYKAQVTLTKDAADYCLGMSQLVLNRPDTLLVLTMAQLQKLAIATHSDTAFTLTMDLLRLVDSLHSFTTRYPAKIIVKYVNQLVVAVNGQISTTALKEEVPMWRIKTAANAAVWWLQNPAKPFEALSASIFQSI